MTSCSVYKLGELAGGKLAGGQRLLVRDGLGIGHPVVSNCIVHHLVFIIIIIIIIISSFAVLLNCLYLNPQVLLFSHSPLHPTTGRGER